MRKSFCLLILFCCIAPICFAIQKRPLPEEVKTFELYSWLDAKGQWNFSLFPAISSAGLAPAVVMRKESTLNGPERIKKAIAKLPAGSEILWLDRTEGMWKGAKGSERLKYPPAESITEIRRFCESRQFKLLVE
jgi:hypothetical protein